MEIERISVPIQSRKKKYSVLLADYINRGGNPPIAVFITKDA